MKEDNKSTNVLIRLNGFSLNLDNVKSVRFSLDGRTVEIVAEDGKTSYETAIQNVLIITERGDEK